ncbi:hypothetical protein CAPTEDRAFT_199476, partial [Capitella teleta]
PPAVTTLGLLSQATRTEGVKIKIKTWKIIEGTVSTGQCDTLKIGIAFSADGSNCLLRLIARQFRKHSDTFLNKESFLCATEKARVADLLKMQPNKSLVQQQLVEDTANVAIQKDQHNITPSLDNEVKMAITKRRANESYETLNEATCSFSVRLSSQSFL